jgi:hypothetical protein
MRITITALSSSSSSSSSAMACALAIAACSDSAGIGAKPTGDAGVRVDEAGAAAAFDSGIELKIPVTESGRVFVKLSPPSVLVAAPADPKASGDWDLAFEGFDIFTNSGVSGGGKGAAFGPLDAVTFVGDTAPQVPFLTIDKSGGAFLDWYAYEGESHALWSRYHVYGVRDGERLWKVQVLSYYGERDGATIPALYKIRYAEVLASGFGPLQEPAPVLDGTAGGTTAPATAPSECIDLGSNARSMLTPADARASTAWHLCFRRDSISVNGEMGGPRGITAVDLESDQVAAETVTSVKTLTADSRRAAFDAANASSFAGRTFRGDRIVSAFNDRWLESAPPGGGASAATKPKNAAWLVQEASGAQKHLFGFARFENATAKSPGTIVARVKPVK